jgi:hypothetical protein
MGENKDNVKKQKEKWENNKETNVASSYFVCERFKSSQPWHIGKT